MTVLRFVRSVFTGRGGTLDRVLRNTVGMKSEHARGALRAAGIDRRRLPRDLDPADWAALWTAASR